MTTKRKRTSKKGADKTTKTTKKRAGKKAATRVDQADPSVEAKVQVDCIKCGASYTSTGTKPPKKCHKCWNLAYNEPARRGPRVKESQKRYAKVHNMTLAQVRELFPPLAGS